MLENWTLWLEQAHFLRPWWLLALIPALLLAMALWFRRGHAGQWQQVIASHLLGYLIEGGSTQRKRWPLFILLALWALAVIALAGPAWQKLPQPVQKSGSALVILWDMSPSMLAQDLNPSRLVRSRLKLVDLLEARREGTTGLVVYAGESHVVTPLTDDTRTLINLLPALSPAIMPMAGSNPEMALRTAFRLLRDAGVPSGQVLFVTDGIARDAFETLAEIQRQGDHQITIWGVGTSEGAPIPLPDGGFARDASGKPVNAKLDEDQLQDFAAEINAYYVPMLTNNEDIETLEQLLTGPGENLRQTDRVFDSWYEHGPWLLLLLLPLVALTFRRGWLMCVPLALIPLGVPEPAHAGLWQDLWQRPDRQAHEALQQQQPERAADLFEDPDWRGTALYRAGDFPAALEAFQQGEATSGNLYNQGNALMQLGDYEAAIESYEAALERNPENEDARFNKTLAEDLLRQQKQEQQQQQENQNGDQQQDNQSQSDAQSDKGGVDNRDPHQDQQQQNSQAQDGEDHQSQPQDNPDNNQEADATASEEAEQSGEQSEKEEQNAAEAEEQTRKQDAELSDAEQQQKPEDGREAQVPSTEMTDAEREQQQALEQWLRRVPDDPSGLIRNKFQHEFRERRRSGDWQPPDRRAGQRW